MFSLLPPTSPTSSIEAAPMMGSPTAPVGICHHNIKTNNFLCAPCAICFIPQSPGEGDRRCDPLVGFQGRSSRRFLFLGTRTNVRTSSPKGCPFPTRHQSVSNFFQT